MLFCSDVQPGAGSSQTMTPWESPGIGKTYKGLFAAHLNFQHHAIWAPNQRWWFSTHHLLVAWTWPWGFRLVEYHFYHFFSLEEYPWKDLLLEHPRSLVLGLRVTSNMPQLEAVAQPLVIQCPALPLPEGQIIYRPNGTHTSMSWAIPFASSI